MMPEYLLKPKDNTLNEFGINMCVCRRVGRLLVPPTKEYYEVHVTALTRNLAIFSNKCIMVR